MSCSFWSIIYTFFKLPSLQKGLSEKNRYFYKRKYSVLLTTHYIIYRSIEYEYETLVSNSIEYMYDMPISSALNKIVQTELETYRERKRAYHVCPPV